MRTESALPGHFALSQLLLAECLSRLAEADPDARGGASGRGDRQPAGREPGLDDRSGTAPVAAGPATARGRRRQRAALVPGGGDAGAEIALLERVLLAASPSADARLLPTAQGAARAGAASPRRRGDLDRARGLADEASRVFEADGDRLSLSLMTRAMGAALSAAGRWEEAAATYERALRAESYLNEAALSVTTQRAHLLRSAACTRRRRTPSPEQRHRWADVLVALERGRAGRSATRSRGSRRT